MLIASGQRVKAFLIALGHTTDRADVCVLRAVTNTIIICIYKILHNDVRVYL